MTSSEPTARTTPPETLSWRINEQSRQGARGLERCRCSTRPWRQALAPGLGAGTLAPGPWHCLPLAKSAEARVSLRTRACSAAALAYQRRPAFGEMAAGHEKTSQHRDRGGTLLPRHDAHGIKAARGSPRLPREAAAEISRPRTRTGEGTPLPATTLITHRQITDRQIFGLIAPPGRFGACRCARRRAHARYRHRHYPCGEGNAPHLLRLGRHLAHGART